MNLRYIALTFLICSLPNVSVAAVSINIEQSGSDVIATATGSLDTSGLPPPITGTAALPIVNYVSPSSYAYIVGQGGGAAADVYLLAFATAQPLNSIATDELGGVSSGGPVGVDNNGLIVPAGYSSGGAINATSTWAGQTIAGLNLTPGTYLFDYGTDSITFNVIDPVSGSSTAVPVPVMPIGLLGLMVISLLGLGVIRMGRD